MSEVEQLQQHIEAYKEKLFETFADYIIGITILPKKEENTTAVELLMLVDDSETKRMSQEELKEKLTKRFEETAKEIHESLKPQVLLQSEFWELCKDGKHEVLQDIALGHIYYDRGMMGGIKLAEVHKQLVLQKFEKYIVAYVLGGSLTQGTATTKSDVDIFIVIDDTDVKKMTRAELRDKLRAIILDQGVQAGEMTGIQNKINIQVYILTDFWDNIKEANPVIFTFLRSGVPFYDRGIFMPWKQLLADGRIKPSQEAIDQFITYGDQYLKRVQLKLRDIGTEDFFWATVTPSQAAIMMKGFEPPTPKELVQSLRDIFVKTGELEEEHVQTVEEILKIRKAIEHGDKTTMSGAEIDDLYKKSEAYVKRLDQLFAHIQEIKETEQITAIYDNTITLIRDALRVEGITPPEKKLVETFEKELIHTGKLPENLKRSIQNIVDAKTKHEKKKLTKTEATQTQQEARELYRFLLEHVQRKRNEELATSTLRIQYQQEKIAELLIQENEVYLTLDLAGEKEYQKLTYNNEWSMPETLALEHVEEAYSKAQPYVPHITPELYTKLRDLLGDFTIIINA